MILRQKDKLSNAYLLFTAAGWARTNTEKNRTHMHTEAPTSDPPTQFLLAGSLSMHGARSTLPNLLHCSAHISLALPCSNRILHSLTFTISANTIYNSHIAVFQNINISATRSTHLHFFCFTRGALRLNSSLCTNLPGGGVFTVTMNIPNTMYGGP